MAKTGIINPATGRDYLECQFNQLSQAEKSAATALQLINDMAQIRVDLDERHETGADKSSTPKL